MSLNLSSQVAAANGLPYATAPFSKGFIVDDYRAHYREHGTTVRVWHSVNMPTGATGLGANGKRYFEQILDADVKVLLSDKLLEVESAEFGLRPIGDLKYSGIPDEITLRLNSRVLAVQDERDAEFKSSFKPDNTLLLPHLYVARVEAVYDLNGAVDASDYELAGRELRWLDGTPPAGVTVAYWYRPQFEFRGESAAQAILASDGGRMPQIVALHLLKAGQENL